MLAYFFDKLYQASFTVVFQLAHILEKDYYYQIREIIHQQNRIIYCDYPSMLSTTNFPYNVFEYLDRPVNVGLCERWSTNEMDDGFAHRTV